MRNGFNFRRRLQMALPLRKRVSTAMLSRQTGESRPQKPQQDPDYSLPFNNWAKDEPWPHESSWVISIEKKLEAAGLENNGCSWAHLSSFRIPRDKDKTNGPKVVSLGPYYHNNSRLHYMDWHKWRCLHRILSRTTNDKIVLYLHSVKEVEDRARVCYEETINMSSDKFVEMMVLDGCFVIELFWGFTVGFKKLGYPHNDHVFSFRRLMHMIQLDMLMLDNQIPLFILDRLFCLLCNEPDQSGLLAKLALQFFNPLMPANIIPDAISINRLEFDPLPGNGELPWLVLFWRSLVHPGPKQVETQETQETQELLQKQQRPIRCVMELLKDGIKFRKGEMTKLWDIQFMDGTLKIPPLRIHDGTGSVFLNLIAFEQCHIDCIKVITSYVIFMVNLINTPEDVGHLHKCGIIEHSLSDAEVANLCNHLSKEADFKISDPYLSQVSVEVNIYSSHSWHRWIAILKREYLSNPWSIISLIAAFILLVLTFTQTFYGVFGYYRAHS